MAKIAHKFETQTSQPEPPVKQHHVPQVKSPVVPETVFRETPKENVVVHPEPVAASPPSPPPTVASPVSPPQQHITQTTERWSLAETVEEVDDAAWKEVDEQNDAWKEEEATDYMQENSNLETVAEETGTGLVAVALYDYQAAAEDELSFDPDDVIVNIEMVIFSLSSSYVPCCFPIINFLAP